MNRLGFVAGVAAAAIAPHVQLPPAGDVEVTSIWWRDRAIAMVPTFSPTAYAWKVRHIAFDPTTCEVLEDVTLDYPAFAVMKDLPA